MTKRQTVIAIIVLVLLFVFSVGFNVWRETNRQPASPIVPVVEEDLTPEPISVQGTINCLDPKDTSGSQVLSCAVGLKTDDNKNYALNNPNDTPAQSGILSGKNVMVTGMLTRPATTYKSDGTILVQTIKPL